MSTVCGHGKRILFACQNQWIFFFFGRVEWEKKIGNELPLFTRKSVEFRWLLISFPINSVRLDFCSEAPENLSHNSHMAPVVLPKLAQMFSQLMWMELFSLQ